MRLERSNLFLELYENINVPYYYNSIEYKADSSSVYLNKTNYKNNCRTSKCFSNQLAPSYLKYSTKKNLKILKVKQHNKGYSIALNSDFKCAEDYIKFKFKNTSKARVLRSIRRLEQCFDITYEQISGKISHEKYHTTMRALKLMLERRFNYKNEVNDILINWESLLNKLIKLIHDKKASFYIIYSDGVPISISLIYHFKDLRFCGILAHNMDYQKFGLGHVGLYKQLELCIKENIKVLEMGYGDLEYKQRWSNMTYNFEHHIIYAKDSFISNILGKYEYNRIKIKEYLKFKKIPVLLASLRKRLIRDNKNNHPINGLEYNITYRQYDEINTQDWNNIDWHNEKYYFLRVYIYNFLYSNIQHLKDITVLKNRQESNSYLVKGKNNFQNIVISPSKT